jgi:TetR/AcrR family transcriptional regulator, lmrAB and yxaGH operons repressor
VNRSTDARWKAVETAARLFQQQGYHGTGLAQILQESGAPKGSFYFHFPRGKEQLAEEAIAASSKEVAGLIEHAAGRSANPAEFIARTARALGRWLADSGYRDGCPVTTVALEMAHESEPLRRACDDAYASWQRQVAAYLEASGHDAAAAADLAALVVSAMEGALLLCRSARSTEPIQRAAARLAPLLMATSGTGGRAPRAIATSG